MLYFLNKKKKCRKENIFWARNMSKLISRNRGATIKASRKTAHDKVFILGQKVSFSIKWQHHQKNVIALNLYIGANVLVYERWLVVKV